MKIDDFKSRWAKIPPAETSFQRVDDSHILDVFLGRDIDGRQEILIVSEQEPSKIDSGKSLSVRKGRRKDDKWATRIKLTRSGSDEVFTHFCWDLIEHSRHAKSKHTAFNVLVERYLKWQKLLEAGSDLMSEEAIKGTIGELLYAERHLRASMDWDKIMSAWLGPDGGEKDYVFDDTWAEVKAVSRNKLTVTISSAEQLESDNPGNLVVVTIDPTSTSDTEGFSFASLIVKFRDLLRSSPSALFSFESKLISLGYVDRPEYEEKCFKFVKDKVYRVEGDFPRLLKDNLPLGVVRLRYDLLLSELEQYVLEGGDLNALS